MLKYIKCCFIKKKKRKKINVPKLALILVFVGNTLNKPLNSSVLTDKYGYSTDSVVIDLSENSIDSIDLTTFKNYVKLEVLYLDENK